MANNSQLIDKLHEMDHQIQEIKAQLDPPKGGLLRRSLRKTPTFVLSNWGFFAFMIAVGLAVWAYWYYDVSYFESQRNIAQSKQSAEFYRKLGDNLMLYGERDAAADSYSKALKINPNNMEATRGLLKTEVFDSLEGQNNIIPEVVDEKIAYLNSLITDDKERFILAYFKGERYEEQEKYDQAKAQYEESIKLNPDFVYGYIAVAYDSILAGDGVDYGMRQLNEALQHDPNSALALNNLGFCYMVKGKYSEALTMFDRARQISPYLEVWINLGEAQRYKGNDDSLEQALDSHKRALGLLSDSKDEDESDIAGELAINFMPERVGDNDTPKSWVTFTNMDEKRTLVYYELSFDYAMRHDWRRANQSFMTASQLDQRGTYPEFIANKIISIERFSEKKPDKITVRWFEKQRHRLLPVS
jgi:tetratricopeptide (TPR) repeat protein